MPDSDDNPSSKTRARAPGARRRVSGALAALCVLPALFVAGCGEGEDKDGRERPPPTVTYFEAARVDLPRRIDTIGQTRAVEQASLTAEVVASVEEALFREGSMVEEGEPLVRLDDAEAAAIVQRRRAERDRLAFDLRRLRDAAERGAASPAELNDAKTALAEAEAALTEAQEILEEYTITAPFDGRVGLRRVSPGDLVEPTDVVTTLVTVDPMEVEFALPGRYATELERGQPIEAMTRAAPDERYRGAVHAINNFIDPVSRSITVLGRLENPEALLRPGVTMDVFVRIGSVEDAIVVPESAVVVEGTASRSFVIDENDVVRRTDVELGVRYAGFVQILEGVEAGDRVVTSDTGALRDGARVDPRPDERLADLGLTLPPRRAEEGDPARPGEQDPEGSSGEPRGGGGESRKDARKGSS